MTYDNKNQDEMLAEKGYQLCIWFAKLEIGYPK